MIQPNHYLLAVKKQIGRCSLNNISYYMMIIICVMSGLVLVYKLIFLSFDNLGVTINILLYSSIIAYMVKTRPSITQLQKEQLQRIENKGLSAILFLTVINATVIILSIPHH